MRLPYFLVLALFFQANISSTMAYAHHVLGRPAYSLNEDSNTPPSMAIETQIGDYFITYMVFPAFPKPNEPGRINIYATRIDNGEIYDGIIKFSVHDNPLFSFSEAKSESIGAQTIDDGVYRQGFLFTQDGNFIIRAEFESGGEPYEIDFPLQVGSTSASTPIGIAILFIIILLAGVSFTQKRKLMRSKVQESINNNSTHT